ncbi:MAG: methyltransferase domain-containing protein, partial [Gammaproteobacteria bacterium]|nr:methyltransferase domain-containing protein [Gammaproteobacteria bacterium]
GPLGDVLEIGTGSGYQTAILARLVRRVYSVERVAPLLNQARERFRELSLRNIRLKHGDGALGMPEYAPFDGILAAAAPDEVPPALLDQLKPGGRMVLPVGRTDQLLVRITRTPKGLSREVLERVAFVPLLAGLQ